MPGESKVSCSYFGIWSCDATTVKIDFNSASSMSQFIFKHPRSREDEESVFSLENEDSAVDIHPVELVAQQVIGPSLDNLSGKLQELQESQLILTARLNILQNNLKQINQNIVIADTKVFVQKTVDLRQKLRRILTVLRVVEKRVQRILENVDQY